MEYFWEPEDIFQACFEVEKGVGVISCQKKKTTFINHALTWLDLSCTLQSIFLASHIFSQDFQGLGLW